MTGTMTYRLYVASYDQADADVLHWYAFDSATGQLSHQGSAKAGLKQSYYVCGDPTGRFLYAADDLDECDGTAGGAVCAMALDGVTGRPTFLNRQPSGGSTPCYLDVTRNGRYVLVANYGGTLGVFPAAPDGKLGPPVAVVEHTGSSVNKERQEAAHTHSFVLAVDNRFAMAGDLGTDKVMIYRFDARTGNISPAATPWFATRPGAGPRHIAHHPDGRHVYVINELDNMLIAFDYDAASGKLDEIQTLSALPQGYKGTSYCADVHVHPSGRFLYGSNRGHESTAIFTIDAVTGRLAPSGHEPTQGQFPRDLALDPDGRFLLAANENSNSIVVFRIDPDTGQLDATGHVTEVNHPACCAFVKT